LSAAQAGARYVALFHYPSCTDSIKYDKQVKNCWEMQQCDCHGEKKKKYKKKKQKKTVKYNVKVSPNSIEFN
jgi:hypothetical protein